MMVHVTPGRRGNRPRCSSERTDQTVKSSLKEVEEALRVLGARLGQGLLGNSHAVSEDRKNEGQQAGFVATILPFEMWLGILGTGGG